MTTHVQHIPADVARLELRTAYGPVYRDVLRSPPREARDDEIPVIDISPMNGDLEARKALAATIKQACENTGFFYISNHGISQNVIDDALSSAKVFFHQPEDKKQLVSRHQGKWFNGYSGSRTSIASPSEGYDHRESFMWLYQPKYDPEPKDPDAIPAEVRPWIRGEDFVWQGTSHLPGFKEGCLTYWQECLKLSRRLVRIFALCLDLPETYFDHLVTYPGSDGVFNYYPAMPITDAKPSNDISLGSHTDLQCFTLLWQDAIGGLQVLNKEGQWIKASPIPGTFVLNVGDYLMRLTNDRFKSTVHRVFNRSTSERYSMPFFFGFNFNESCGVLPSCVDEKNPAKYEPVSCGEWCQLRFRQANVK